MTLKKRYDEVMDRIEITDEMRGRILGNIQSMDIAVMPERKVISLPNIKKYVSVAACLGVLLAGALAAGHMTGIFQPDDPNVAVVNGIAEVDTLEQLAAAVGFDVEERNVLPFEVESTAYISYWNELAEITYTGDGQTAVFRKSKGTENNSGDYGTYSAVEEINIGSLTATLKGSGETYMLATWSADGYAYSIRLAKGISELEWRNLICN